MRRIRGRRTGGAFGVLLGLMCLALSPAASAQSDIPVEELLAPEDRWVVNCPRSEEYPPGFPEIACLRVKAYDGELKLGKTEATIDEPLEIVAGVGVGAGNEPKIVLSGGAEGDGSAAISTVKVPGGLLGIPELDPLLDPLGVLSVSATPQLGEIDGEMGSFPQLPASPCRCRSSSTTSCSVIVARSGRPRTRS